MGLKTQLYRASDKTEQCKGFLESVGKAELVKRSKCVLSGKDPGPLWSPQPVASILRLLGNETMPITMSLRVIKPEVFYHSCCFFFLDSTALSPICKTIAATSH